MKTLLVALVTALGALVSLPASAQFQKPEDAIKYRKAAFTVMGAHFGRIGAMASGKAPFDAAAAAANADLVSTMSRLPYAGFIEGTATGDTRAKPEIWTERAKFDAAASSQWNSRVGKSQTRIARVSARVVMRAGRFERTPHRR